MIVDGFDLRTLGFESDAPAGWRDVPPSRLQAIAIPGRAGVSAIADRPQVEARALSLSGIQSASNAATLLTQFDQLKRRLSRREVQVVFPDRSDRFFRARLESISASAIRPAFTQRAHHLRILLVCEDPRAHQTTESALAFGAATAMPLGDAPVRPVLAIASPSNPVIIYRDAAGLERGRMELTISSASAVTIDCDRLRIVDNAGDPRPEALTGGDFLELDPADANAAGTSWPTLEVTGGAGTATYRRAWW